MGDPEFLLPQISIESTSIDFSTITIGSPQTRQIRIINSGEADLSGELTLVQDNTAYELQPEGAFIVLPGDTLLVELTFTPTAELTYAGQVLISSDDIENPDLSITLKGVGTAMPVPVLNISTGSINFGNILISESQQHQITLSNTGNDTLLISSIDFDPDVYEVDVITPFALGPEVSQALIITFEPGVAGTYSGTMTISSNTASTTNTVSLSGSAGVSYIDIVQPIFNSNCSGCHGSNGGLSLSTYNNLMAGTSTNGPVVVVGDGANSLIVRKLRGQAGSRMPQGGAALANETIAMIETWINQGALNF